MCGIDELFSSNSLEEKTEFSERFIQVLDEFGVVGDFRNLLEKYFTNTWHRELDISGDGNIQRTKEALKATRHVQGLAGKISAFVQSFDIHAGGWLQHGLLRAGIYQLVQDRYPSRVAFAQACATQVFPDSPYGFFQCFKAPQSSLEEFDLFILFFASPYFGENCHLIPLLFKDEHLRALGERERRDVLWAVFDSMVRFSFSGEGGHFQLGCSPDENLKKLYVWDIYASVPNREISLYHEAFDYLCAWIGEEARFQDYSVSLGLLEKALLDMDQKVFSYSRAFTCSDDESKGFENWATNWWREKSYVLKKAWCCNVNLEGLSDGNFDVWARRSYECFLPLCKDLSEERAARLIVWGIEEDLKKWLTFKSEHHSLLDPGLCSEMWYVSVFRELWRSHLINAIHALSFADRLNILGLRFGWKITFSTFMLPEYLTLSPEFCKEGEDDAYYEFRVASNDIAWWDSLLRLLPEDILFTNEFYPDWTLKALSRFGYSEALVFSADKSLGVLRGNGRASEKEFSAEEIGKLIQILEHFNSEKAVRHRLLLLRSSQRPYATENLDVDRASSRPETMSEILQKLLVGHFAHESRRHLRGDERLQEELLLYSSVRAWIAQFCLSRLKLRKGEKTENDSYTSEQVVEPSPIWRKAYLKVLEELGVDLQGQVHKAVFFIRKFDPVEDVREVAKACYKAVRRGFNKSETGADIRRGLTAAYWWLLLAQRHELKLPINKEEAVETRRRLLRRP